MNSMFRERRRDVVLARWQPVEAELSEVVGAVVASLRAGRDEPPGPAHVRIALHLHLDGRDRLAELVEDAPADGAAAGQREVHLVECLAVDDLDRGARLIRRLLAELHVDVAAAHRRDDVAAGGELRDFVPTLGVGLRDAVAAAARREGADLHAPERRARIRGHHLAADGRGSAFVLARATVASRRLDAWRRRCQDAGDGGAGYGARVAVGSTVRPVNRRVARSPGTRSAWGTSGAGGRQAQPRI